MLRYKLVTQDFKTRAGESNETTWIKGVTHTATGTGGLCTDGVIHSYETPALAVLLNPIHANIRKPRLIAIECSELVADDSLKGGHKSATMIGEVELPAITNKQRVIFAILCARAALYRAQIPEREAWANKYLPWTAYAASPARAASYAAVYASYAQGIKIDFAALAHTACNTKNPHANQR